MTRTVLEERRCVGCGAVLSRYNSGSRCMPCQETGMAESGDIRALLAEGMGARLAEGLTTEQAALAVLESIRERGLADAFLDEFGILAVTEAWRSLPSGHPHGIAGASPGPRKVSVRALTVPTSVMESLYRIGGEWRRLGDMTRAELEALADRYEADARRFRHLAKRLEDGQTVADCWGELEVKAVMEEDI